MSQETGLGALDFEAKRAGNESVVHHQAKIFVARLLTAMLPSEQNQPLQLQTAVKGSGVWLEYPLPKLETPNIKGIAFSHKDIPLKHGGIAKRRKLLALAIPLGDTQVDQPYTGVRNLHNVMNSNLRCSERRKIRTTAKRLNLMKVVDVALVVDHTLKAVVEVVNRSKMTQATLSALKVTYPTVVIEEVSILQIHSWQDAMSHL
jgi:hypothetical protein